jgi:hypothetical protein
MLTFMIQDQAKELFLNICSRKWDFESVCHEETISEIISKIKQMEVFVECAVEDFYSDHEKPHTVMFFPLPNLDCETLETESCFLHPVFFHVVQVFQR